MIIMKYPILFSCHLSFKVKISIVLTNVSFYVSEKIARVIVLLTVSIVLFHLIITTKLHPRQVIVLLLIVLLIVVVTAFQDQNKRETLSRIRLITPW